MNFAELETFLKGKTCVKCDKDAKFTGTDPKKAWYCQECFILMVRNKFRSAISKKKIYKDVNSRETLIVFDGTPSGAFLLNQINDALKQITYKRLMVKPTVLVLVSVMEDAEINLVMNRVKEIKEELLESVSWIVAHVACSIYKERLNLEESKCNGIEKISEYKELLKSCSVTTYRKEIERILKEKCIQNIATSTGISKCMVSDDSDDLGRLSLDQMCLGRGGSTSTLVAVTDKRPGIMLIRPLCDLSKKEIAIYNHLYGIDNQCIQIKFPDSEEKSVQRLTDSFIRTLENEMFYSTISTVLSTVAKIHNTTSGKENSRCPLCQIETSSSVCTPCSEIRKSCTSDIIDRFFIV